MRYKRPIVLSAILVLAVATGLLAQSTRFTDNGNGTLTDTKTGLVWMKDGNAANAMFSHDEALAYIKQLNTAGTCGSTNWRLPSHQEMLDLLKSAGVNPGQHAGWLAAQGFTNVQNNYWTSSVIQNGNMKQAVLAFIPYGIVMVGNPAIKYWVLSVHDAGIKPTL